MPWKAVGRRFLFARWSCLLRSPLATQALHDSSTLHAEGLRSGDLVCALARKPSISIFSGRQAHSFAAVRENGTVLTWGEEESGGDSSCVQSQLVDVKEVHVSVRACAAIRKDGGVVTWGCEDLGGDSSDVEDELFDVKLIRSTAGAFAACRGRELNHFRGAEILGP